LFFINLRLYILIIFCIFTNLFKIKNDNVMKNLMIFFFMITSLLGFSQSSISFVKHMSADFDSYDISEVDCMLVVNNYDGDLIKFSVTVSANVNENTLSQLFKIGRYNISVKDGVISFDRIKNTILINGFKVLEDIKVEVLVPYGINFTRPLLN